MPTADNRGYFHLVQMTVDSFLHQRLVCIKQANKHLVSQIEIIIILEIEISLL
jgi:hypothetical protein